MKTIYYLSGLPRAGNTLLSSILNQNPKINTTPLSYINGIVYNAFKEYQQLGSAKNFPDKESFHNSMSSVIYNYYKGWSGDIIIQRSTIGNFPELEVVNKYLKNEFKVIVLVRDIFEIISSFIKLYKEDENYFLNTKFGKSDVEKINFLIEDSSLINMSLKSTYNLYYGWYKHCLFIQYNDLIKDTPTQIKKIYNFLNLESFEHTYTNLNQFKVNNICYDDTMYGKNLHKIKTDKIQKGNSFEYKKYIPENIFSRLEFVNNWLNGI